MRQSTRSLAADNESWSARHTTSDLLNEGPASERLLVRPRTARSDLRHKSGCRAHGLGLGDDETRNSSERPVGYALLPAPYALFAALRLRSDSRI